METAENQAILKDLVQITNDRITAFEKVEGKIWEAYPDIKSEYDKMITQSKIMKNELIDILRENEKEYDSDSSTVRGNLHSTWIDIKNAFQISSVNSTLENVVSGEKAAVDSYREALKNNDFTPPTKKTLEDHLHDLTQAYEQFEKTLEYRKNNQ
ncbi:DUF2383 domain-containing protein [Chryseobacterium sp.]|uniref:DUF2383 domain-containing protein n=1 Tax=Chryseobacterium sp. TaxID=1871047 RepID=UPI0028A20B5B|nr:DUF2383 domain-containing protein [Chryseobacterium sp.]